LRTAKRIVSRPQVSHRCLLLGSLDRVPPINLSHYLLSPANGIEIAATVAGTRFPPSYWASFRAAKIDAAISRKQVASAFGARPLLHCNRGVLRQ
jgi:hypothetical protein